MERGRGQRGSEKTLDAFNPGLEDRTIQVERLLHDKARNGSCVSGQGSAPKRCCSRNASNGSAGACNRVWAYRLISAKSEIDLSQNAGFPAFWLGDGFDCDAIPVTVPA